jgi:hypothetical protein
MVRFNSGSSPDSSLTNDYTSIEAIVFHRAKTGARAQFKNPVHFLKDSKMLTLTVDPEV